jgi:hypothetical protein
MKRKQNIKILKQMHKRYSDWCLAAEETIPNTAETDWDKEYDALLVKHKSFFNTFNIVKFKAFYAQFYKNDKKELVLGGLQAVVKINKERRLLSKQDYEEQKLAKAKYRKTHPKKY